MGLFDFAQRFLEDAKKKVQSVFAPKPAPRIVAPIPQKNIVKPTPTLSRPLPPTPKPVSVPTRPAVAPSSRMSGSSSPSLAGAAQRLFQPVKQAASSLFSNIAKQPLSLFKSPISIIKTPSPTIGETAKFAKDVALATVRAPQREGVRLAQTISKDTKPFVPTSKGEKFFFGEEPIVSHPEEAKKGATFLKEKTGLSEKYGLPLAGVGSLFMGALDVTPFGGPGKQALKQGIKQTVKTGAKTVVKEVAPIIKAVEKVAPVKKAVVEDGLYDTGDIFVANKLGAKVEKSGDGVKFITKDGNSIYVELGETPQQVAFNYIKADKTGTGLGTKLINTLKDYADETGKAFSANKITNNAFFDKFNFFQEKQGLGNATYRTYYPKQQQELLGLKQQLTKLETQAPKAGEILGNYNPSIKGEEAFTRTKAGQISDRIDQLKSQIRDIEAGRGDIKAQKGTEGNVSPLPQPTTGGVKPSLFKQTVKTRIPIKQLQPLEEEGFELASGSKSFTKGSIDIVQTGDGPLVLNGHHRVAEAIKLGKQDIEVNILSSKEAIKKYGKEIVGLEGILEISPPALFKSVKETPVFKEPEIPNLMPAKPTSVIEEIKGGFEGGRKAREAVEKTVKGSLGQRVRTQLVDRLTPVYDFVNQAAKQLSAEQNPYRKMRLLAGTSGKVEAFLDRSIAPVLKREVARQDDLATLLVLDREKELLGRGLVRKRTAEQVEQGYQELIAKYGDEGYKTLQDSAVQLRKAGDELLDMLHDAGVIDDTSFNAIRKNNQFYAPMEAIEHIADSLEKGRFGNGSFNVASQDVIKGIGSYTGDVADPIEALLRKIPKVIGLVEKNKAMQSLVNLRKEFPDVYSDLIIPVKGGKAPAEMGVISVFENGKNVDYAVPEVVESAIKNLDKETANILVSLGSIQAKMLRAGATGLNIAFIPVNIIRDVQDALTTELTEKGIKAMFQFLGSYPQAIFSAAKKGDLYQEWAAAGGLQSTMTEQIFKSTPKTVAELSGKRNIIKTVINSPKALVMFANRVGEQSTRLARFKSGVGRGESTAEAAFKSRDISLDFAKAGDKIKVLNQIIPFLNAGIQGSEKLLRLYKNNPKAAIASTGVLFGMPTVALYTYNSQFKDFDDIPDAERQTNWIIIARDRTDDEIAAGEKIVGIKIPKGFLGRMVANTLDSSMDFMRSNDPSTFASAAVATLGGISPVGVTPTQIASTLTPPWLQAGIEAITNTDLYYGSRIVPRILEGVKPKEQYKETTPEIYKTAGNFGISPLILENIINSTTGGVGRQAASLFSGDIEGAAVDPIARRFFGIRGGEANSKMWDKISAADQESKTNSLQVKRQAEEALAENERMKQSGLSKEERDAYFNALPQEVRDVAHDLVKKKDLTPLESRMRYLSVEARSKVVNDELNEMKAEGLSKEEQDAWWNNLQQKGIITIAVNKRIRELREETVAQQQVFAQ